MDVTEMSLYHGLGILLISQVCSSCIHVQCLSCNITDDGTVCFNEVPGNCTLKDFQVSLNSSGGFALDEGDSITMNCTHNLPPLPLELPLEFTWKKDAHTLEGRNASSLTLMKVFTIDQGQYTCGIQSRCGNFSSLPQKVTVATNSAVILIICGLSAVFLVVCLGLAMKYKLKTETAQNRRRKLQLQQNQRGPEMRPRDA